MKRIVLLLAALTLPAMAAAASGSATAMTHATVAFYSGFPSTGGKLLVKANARSDTQASAQKVIAKADSVVITVSGHAYTFALDQAAKAKGRAEVDVKGALQATGHGKAKLAAVVKELAQAQSGDQSLVVLSRAQGSGHVVVALYHPDGGNAGLRVKNADRATVWVGGKAHAYPVASDGGTGVMSSLHVKASNGQQTLTSTVADLQARVTLGASTSGATGGSGSSDGSSTGTGGSGSAGAGLNVTVGGGN